MTIARAVSQFNQIRAKIGQRELAVTIKGVGEVSADLGTMAKTAALGAIKGTREAALSLEEAAIVTARAVIRDVGTLRTAPVAVGKVESVEVEPSPEPIVTGSTNILSIAPVVVAGTRRKRSKAGT